MPTTIAAEFAGLRANLEITNLQAVTTSTRQQSVRAAMERGFTVLDSFLAGSYARSTMIGPLSACDIDIIVVLDASYWRTYQAAPGALLDAARKVLLQTYTTTPRISRNGQAVTITFTDFEVDVVPAFSRQGGGYLIPNMAGNWIATNPAAHAALITSQNALHSGSLVPLIKMVKAWNRVNSDTLVGFYLELMTTDILTNVRITDFPSGVRFVFDKARDKVRFKQPDPSGIGDQVNGLRSGSVQDAVTRLTSAYEDARYAEQLASLGRIYDATNLWRRIFGDYFPAYG